MTQLFHRAHVGVVSKVREHGRADTPLHLVNALLLQSSAPFLEGLSREFCVDDLVEPSQDIAASDIFEGHACLHEQTALWNLDSAFLPVTGPDRES